MFITKNIYKFIKKAILFLSFLINKYNFDKYIHKQKYLITLKIITQMKVSTSFISEKWYFNFFNISEIFVVSNVVYLA